MSLPESRDVERFEKALPGSGDRLLTMAELEQRHQHRTVLLGQMLGFVIALSFLGVSAWLILAGHEITGAVLGTVDLVALVTVFVVGRNPMS